MNNNNFNRKYFLRFFNLLTFFLLSCLAIAQQATSDSIAPQTPTQKGWYEKISIRGYTQIRYNRLLETNPLLECEQCDKSWGENGGFFLRRIRLVFFGNVHERVYVYIQPDFASAISSTSLHYTQIRDAYFDLALDKNKEFRLRLGQSKIPFGFENLQSSQNRLPLDRNDGLNSAVANERDLGVFFYWAPKQIRERFSHLVKSGLKGSGDYGVFGFGLFNGQTANRPEANNHPHAVARLTYPFMLKNGQFIEASIQGYQGHFVLLQTDLKNVQKEYFERRVAATFVYYPQPFGFQGEFNIGQGPQFNPETMNIENQDLFGGYVQSMYMIKTGKQIIIPFARWHYYEGGKKHELDARSYLVNEQEIGIEWQPFENFELVAMYTISDRTFEDSKRPDNRQTGRLLRLQAQFNF